MTEWLQEVGCNKDWNFVQFEAKKPGCLGRIEASGKNLPTEEFALLFDGIHTFGFLISGRNSSGVCDTQNSSWFDWLFGTFEAIALGQLYVTGDGSIVGSLIFWRQRFGLT